MIDTSPPPEVAVTYSVGDLIALNAAVRLKWLRLLVVLIGVMIGAQIVFPLLGGQSIIDAVRSLDWVPIGLALFIVFAILVLSPFLTIRARKRNGWDIPLQFAATLTSIEINHSQGRTEMLWSAVKRIKASKDRLFIFTSPACAYILPKRCFQNRTDFDRWIDFSRASLEHARASQYSDIHDRA